MNNRESLTILARRLGFGLALIMMLAASEAALAEDFDVVLAGGRVLDPESGLDAVRNVGIRGGTIAVVSEDRLAGRETIDVSGLVVAPGFIDLHAHGQGNIANRYQAMDGVTTALDLEGGRYPISDYYRDRAGQAVLNFGVSVSHHGVRLKVKHGIDAGWTPEGRQQALANLGDNKYPAWSYEPASPEDLDRILALFGQKLAEGGLGIGMGLEHTPGVGYDEVTRIFEFAASQGAPVFVHVRRARGELVAAASNVASIQEVLANAAGTGARLHIVHITPSSVRQTSINLALIEGARRAGVDVSTEAYPYTAGMTSISSAAFDDGWQQRLSMTYGDLQWVATGERLTKESFGKYRRQAAKEGGGGVIAHFIPQDAMYQAIAHPMVQIASDGGDWVGGRGHPRGAGTFARVLGHHVRERGDLTLTQAIAKMTLMPAQRLEDYVPEMKNKGRMAKGADADITVFSAETVIDRATYAEPMQYSAGIRHVLVNGVFVVRDGKLAEDVYPGRAVRRQTAAESGDR